MGNIDRISSILSSNCYEQYFGILVKYSQGKRLNQDKTDHWRMLQIFVAGLRSKTNFTSDLFVKVGVGKTDIGIDKWRRMETRATYQTFYHKQEKQVVRRKVTKKIRDHLMAKDTKHEDRHKSEKLKPSDKPVAKQRKTQTKGTIPCTNCGTCDHTKTECAEPIKQSLSTKVGINVKGIHMMFLN